MQFYPGQRSYLPRMKGTGAKLFRVDCPLLDLGEEGLFVLQDGVRMI